MLSIRIPKQLEDRLEQVCKINERTKTYYIRKALEAYLEDVELALLAEAVIKRNEKTIPFDEVKKSYYAKNRSNEDMEQVVQRPAKSYSRPGIQKAAKARNS